MGKPKLRAIGSNIFAGGFTVGVAKHFNVVAHLEHDDYGLEIARKNFPALEIRVGKDAWPEKLNGHGLDFLYSNPPCAIWSLAGNRAGRPDWRQDPRLQRIRDIFALVDRYRPAVWCWESICLAYERGREFVDELVDAAAVLGYSATLLFVDAQYLRAPQKRRRFFLVLHRVAIDWEQARPDFSAPPVTPRQVLQGIQPDKRLMLAGIPSTALTDRACYLLPLVKPGGNFRTEYLRRNGGIGGPGSPSMLARRSDLDRPNGVLYGFLTFHPTEDRLLAVNELGALHGFPPAFDWISNRHREAVQRGVLPPVGEWLARHVAAAIRAGRAVTTPTRTLVDFRAPPGQIVLADESAAISAACAPAPRVKIARPRRGTIRIPWNGLTSGEFIRALLLERKHSDEAIAAAVRARFEGRRTTPADVAWNRLKITKNGGPRLERILAGAPIPDDFLT